MKVTTDRDPDRLYRLVPAWYRETDAPAGYPLRALLRLIGAQADMLRTDVGRLLDDGFVETAEHWAIPYIGELVGNDLLHDVDMAPASATAEDLFRDLVGPNLRPISLIRTRADVAKTIYYRRRKGTPPMLEELARDVTGWPAHVVEFFERLTWTQNLEHLRPWSTDAPDIRRTDVGDRVHGPFDEVSHTVDVRRIGRLEGWYGIRNIGFFLFRLRDYPLQDVMTRNVGPAWRRTFSPLGTTAPLFSAWRREGDEAGLATERFIPAPIRAAAFFEDLRAAAPGAHDTDLYGDVRERSDASIAVYEDGVYVPADKIVCRNLGHWTTTPQPPDDKIAIDARRGRLLVGALRPVHRITVAYRYGFSGDLGGGPYERGKWLADPREYPARITVGAAATADKPTLNAALLDWAANHRGEPTVIEILDDRTYELAPIIDLHAVEPLVIQASSRARPHIQPTGGEIVVAGAAPGASLTLSGLLIEGGIRVDQEIRRLRILHTTLVPGRRVTGVGGGPGNDASITITASSGGHPINAEARLEIAFSICGPIRMSGDAIGLWLLDSIVDSPRVGGARGLAIADALGSGDPNASGPRATIERSTILGATRFRLLDLGSESIFFGPLQATRTEEGCLRFSYVEPGSRSPQQFRCQPELARANAVDDAREAAASSGTTLSAAQVKAIGDAAERPMVPDFMTTDYGQPAYAQLRLEVPPGIRTGAEDGSEMGAFNHLKQHQRETNLRIRLEEYLPFGLEAGLIYVT